MLVRNAVAVLSSLATSSFGAGHSSITSHAVRAAATSAAAAAGGSPLPLTQYTYAYSELPYKINPYPVGRGPQSGYNQCNSTTGGPDSQCQTLIVNDLADFCIWGSPTTTPNETIGDVEAATVAYCTTDKHGARALPAGSITGAQLLRTSAYIQITGRMNAAALNLASNDTGGELDPHGADLLGNPLGAAVYSTSLPSGDNTTLTQVIEWNNFVGGGLFCIKLCDPKVTSPRYCENKFDLIGCAYNMPASYADNEFTSCDAELQEVVGTYTSGGQTFTWSQPSSLPATSTLPWTPVIPSSSNCVTYSSAQLFGTGSATTTATPTGSGTAGGNQATSKSGSSSSAAATNTSKATGGAASLALPGLLALAGTLLTIAA